MRVGICGIGCYLCQFYKAGCEGCESNGKECPITTCARNRDAENCFQCDMLFCELQVKNFYFIEKKIRSELTPKSKRSVLVEFGIPQSPVSEIQHKRKRNS